MKHEFITTNSRLTVDQHNVWEKRIVQPAPTYWFGTFMALLLLLILTVYDAVTENTFRWLYVLVILFWLSPHLQHIYQLLFVRVWRWYVPLTEIKKIHLQPDYNDLEEKVIITLKSGRQKVYLFRRSEEQAQPFAALITAQLQNPLPATPTV